MDNKKKLQKKTDKKKEQRTLMSFSCASNCICDCMSPGMGHPYEGASHNKNYSLGNLFR